MFVLRGRWRQWARSAAKTALFVEYCHRGTCSRGSAGRQPGRSGLLPLRPMTRFRGQGTRGDFGVGSAARAMRLEVSTRFPRVRSQVAAFGHELSSLPPYPAALVLALGLLCLVDSATVGGPRTVAYGVFLACFVLSLGTLCGLLWQCGLLIVGRVAGRVAFLPWVAATVVVSLRLADRLGAFARIDSRYSDLALLTLAGCGVSGLLLGAVLGAAQVTKRHPQGLLLAASARVRGLMALALALGCVALACVDRTMYVGLYLDAHVALRLCSACVLMLALVLCAPRIKLPRVGKRAVLLACLAFVVPVAGMWERDADTVQAFVARPWPATLLRSSRALLDFDGDGFAFLLAGGDCNDFDARVNPTAREIPDNGIDDNCAFGDRKKRLDPIAATPIPSTPSPMNVVLITVDCLRWDRLGANDPKYGPLGRDTMPAVTALAGQAVRFTRAYAPGAWTSISLGATLRGQYARRLSWMSYYETTLFRLLRKPLEGRLVPDEQVTKMFPIAWQAPNPPLPEWLSRRGMQTMAVVDDGFSQMLAQELGVSRGFDAYREVNAEPTDQKAVLRASRQQGRRSTERDDSTTATLAVSSLRMRDPAKKFFLWVHFFGAHTPSTVHPGAKIYGPSVEDGYDHEVRYVDSQIKRVLDAVGEVHEKTAVFVTADHGEFFFGPYRSHGNDLAEDVIHVPLVARVPGWAPRVTDSLVSLVDLMPTVLAMTGTPPPPGLDGIDLARTLAGNGPPRRILFSDLWQYDREGHAVNDLVTAFDGKSKVVLSRLDHSFSLYDQKRPSAPAIRIEGLAIDKLARSILGYVVEAGEDAVIKE